jgi:ppGpp synthetase/RelA/SpoT-type nucleotidyltranferase
MAVRRLGEALRGGTEPPTGCPPYPDVMLWHTDLAAEIEAQIDNGSWPLRADLPPAWRMSAFRVSSRAKTQDTLIEKLRRKTTLQLNAVQDIAGVRIDGDLLLGEQTSLAREFANHFGEDVSAIHDLRNGAHAGYRGVHLCLRMPAGRVEIQIRTALQSLWANAYERLADKLGRGIRYGAPINEVPPDWGVDLAKARALVSEMHDFSAQLAKAEADWQADSELDDPDQRARWLNRATIYKAMFLAKVLPTLRGEINPASWLKPEGG